MADQMSRRTNQIVTGQGSAVSVQYLMAPVLAGSGVGGAVLAAGAGPGWGAYTQIINGAGLAVAVEYWVCGLSVYTAGGIQVMEFDIQNTTLALVIANFLIDATAVTLNVQNMYTPGPVYCAQPTICSARTGGAAAKACNARIIYAVGL